MKLLHLLFFTALFCNLSFAQNQRILHQSFEMDTATTLQLDLHGTFVVEPWVGNAILIETQVHLFDTPEGVFNHHIKEGRYEIESKLEGTTLFLTAKDKERRPIKTLKGTSKEEVVVKIFMPDRLQPAGANTWTKPKE
jgi:hypothetical protein